MARLVTEVELSDGHEYRGSCEMLKVRRIISVQKRQKAVWVSAAGAAQWRSQLAHTKPTMDAILKSRLTQFWFHVQEGLLPFLAEIDMELTPALKQVATMLDMSEIKRFVPSSGLPPRLVGL